MRNKPIRVQFLLVFLAFLILLFGIIALANMFLLKPFYVFTKTEQLKSVSQKFDHVDMDTQDEDFQTLLEKTVYGDQTMIDVFDSEGQHKSLFTPRNPPREQHENRALDLHELFTPKDWQRLKDGHFVVKEMKDMRHNQELLTVYRTLPDGDILSLGSAMAAIEQSVMILNEFLVLVLLLFLVLVWICATRFANYFARPIVTLQQMTNRMIQFDFSQTWQQTRADELGVLGTNMNKLMSIIGNFIEELKGKNELLESELERKNKLDRMRKQFVSNVSHELKTPIALIQGYAEGLRLNVNEDQASREEYCDVIMDEARKMNELLRELLLLSQLELGVDALKQEPFDIINSLQTAVTRFRSLSANQGVSFELDFEAKCYEVVGDGMKINQVINNYLANALFFVSGDKRIRVAAKLHDGLVRVSVFNTGPHIPEEEIELIWTSFYKVDKARTRGEGGTGLGLSIVRRIMDLHQMEAGVANIQDGVLFWFDLPLHDPRIQS